MLEPMRSGMMVAGMAQRGMMQEGAMGDGMMGWGVGWIFPILILVALVLLIVWLFREIRGGGTQDAPQQHDAPQQDASEIARQRYARGEISREDLRTILDDLSE